MSIPAGRYWTEQYPTGRTTGSLEEPFQTSVEKMITALEAGGADVDIAATRRPRERAYLMRGAWDIVNEGVDPADVPAFPGIDIEWTREGAAEMVAIYRLAYRPSLTSRHIEGKAIDMSITWKGLITVTDARGVRQTLDWSKLADRTTRLYAFGATFGVKKLVKDPPHWSTDGR